MYKSIIISTLLTLNILVAQSIELGTVTITSATKTSQSIEDVTSNVNVITSKEIEERNYLTVTEALNSISGINFTSNGGLGKSTAVYLRGMDSKRTLVLIDGIRYNDITGLNGAPFADLMIGDIDKIEVVKGAQSGIWGADASAGVINIITKSAKKGLHASIKSEYGSFNTKKNAALASYKADTFYIKAGLQRVDTNGFTAQAPKGDDISIYEDDGYTNMTSNVKLGFNLNKKNKIDIAHTIIDSENEYDSFGNPDGLNDSTTENSFSQINFNHINDFTEIDIYSKQSIFDRGYSSGSEYDGEVIEYGLKSTTDYNSDDLLVLGTDYKSFEHQNDLQEIYTNKALFLTNSNTFKATNGGKTIITESIRFDDYDKFKNKTTGKLGIKHFYKHVKGLTTSANVGSAYNVPTLYNLYSSLYGNANLTPENTKSYDLSLGYKQNFKLTYFNSITTDMIDWSGTYQNVVGETTFQGVEIEYNTKLGKKTAIKSSYTYLDARNSDDEILRRRARDTFKLSVDYYGIKGLHLGASGEYIGDRYSKDDELGEQTGRYAVVNLVANYKFNKHFSAYVKVDNLFNEYYQVIDGYATAPLSGYAGVKAQF